MARNALDIFQEKLDSLNIKISPEEMEDYLEKVLKSVSSPTTSSNKYQSLEHDKPGEGDIIAADSAKRFVSDEGAVQDLLGNLLWSLQSNVTFGASDIANEISGGALANAYGSQPWEDESLWGKVGFTIGEVAGVLASFGMAKVAQKTIGGVGSAVIPGFKNFVKRTASRQINSKVAKELGGTTSAAYKGVEQGLGDDILGEGWKAIGEVGKKTGTRTYSNTVKKFSNEIYGTLHTNLSRRFKDLDSNTIDLLTKEIFSKAQKTAPGSLNVAMASIFGSGRMGRWAEHALAEATLMGFHTTMHTGTSVITAGLYDRKDLADYHKSHYVGNMITSMSIGLAMPIVRTWKGGKAVEASAMGLKRQSGVLADIGRIIPAIKKNVGAWKKNQNPRAQRGAILRMRVADETFLSRLGGHEYESAGQKFLTQGGENLKGAEEFYDKVFNKIREQLKGGPGVFELFKEMGKDLSGSLHRMVAGSVIFNARGWYEDMNLEEERRAPWDRKMVDFLTGMMYAKRGTTPGALKKTRGKFYNYELARTFEMLDAVQITPSRAVEYVHHYEMLTKTPYDIASDVVSNSESVKPLREHIGEDMLIGIEEFKKILKSEDKQDFGSTWGFWMAKKTALIVESSGKIDNLKAEQRTAREAGHTEKVKELEIEISKELNLVEATTKEMELRQNQKKKFEMMFDVVTGGEREGTAIRPFDKDVADRSMLEMLDRYDKIKLGQKEYTSPLELGKAIRELSQTALSNEVINMQERVNEYIYNSLVALGLVVPKEGRARGDAFEVDADAINKIKKLSGTAEDHEHRQKLSELAKTMERWEGTAYNTKASVGADLPLFKGVDLKNGIGVFESAHKDYLDKLHLLLYPNEWEIGDNYYNPTLGSDRGWLHAVRRWRYPRDLSTAQQILGREKDVDEGTLSGRQKDLREKINRLYGGHANLKLKADDIKEGVDDVDVLQLDSFLKNLNIARSVSGPGGSGNKEISIEASKLLLREFREEVGDFLIPSAKRSAKDGLNDFMESVLYNSLKKFEDDPANETYAAGGRILLQEQINLSLMNRSTGKWDVFTEGQVRDFLLTNKVDLEKGGENDQLLVKYGELISELTHKLPGLFSYYDTQFSMGVRRDVNWVLKDLKDIKSRMEIAGDKSLSEGVDRTIEALKTLWEGTAISIMSKATDENKVDINLVLEKINTDNYQTPDEIKRALIQAISKGQGTYNEAFVEEASRLFSSVANAKRLVTMWGRNNRSALRGLFVGDNTLKKALSQYNRFGVAGIELLMADKNRGYLHKIAHRINMGLLEAVNKYAQTHKLNTERDLVKYISDKMNAEELDLGENRLHDQQWFATLEMAQGTYGLSPQFVEIFKGNLANVANMDAAIQKILTDFIVPAGLNLPENWKTSMDVFELIDGMAMGGDTTPMKRMIVNEIFTPILLAQSKIIDTIRKTIKKDTPLPPGTRPSEAAFRPSQDGKQFLQDMTQIIIPMMGRKRIMLATYDNKKLIHKFISTPSFSHGFSGVLDILKVNNSTDFMLEGSKSVYNKLIWDGNLAEGKLESMLWEGVFVEQDPVELTRNELKKEDTIMDPIDGAPSGEKLGTGKGSAIPYHRVVLDEKTTVYVSEKGAKILRSQLNDENSYIRRLIKNTLGDNTEGFLQDQGLTNPVYSKTQVRDALWVTRLAIDNSAFLSQWHSSGLDASMKLKYIKYLSMAEANSGTAPVQTRFVMDANNNVQREVVYSPIHAARDLMKNFVSEVPEYQPIINVIESKMIDPLDIKKGFKFNKQLLIEDGIDAFDTLKNARFVLERNLAERLGLSGVDAISEKWHTEIEKVLDILSNSTKEFTDAATFATRDEMIFAAASRGPQVTGDANWFVMGGIDGKEITGVNFAAKPITTSNRAYKSYAEHRVFYSKTANVYIPGVDALLKELGVDNITFTSAGKNAFVGKRDAQGQIIYDKKKVALNLKNVDTGEDAEAGRYIGEGWDSLERDLRGMGRQKRERYIYYVDRSDIMYKSLVLHHHPNISYGFGHFLNNAGQQRLSRWLGSSQNGVRTQEAMSAAFSSNPYEVANLARRLSGLELERGDITSRLTGVEAIVAEQGFPLFDKHLGAMQRSIAAQFIQASNMGSGSAYHGSTSVMFPDFGFMTVPFRVDGVQRWAGGTNINRFEAQQSVKALQHGYHDLFSENGTERGTLRFQITQELANILNKQIRDQKANIDANLNTYDTRFDSVKENPHDDNVGKYFLREGDEISITMRSSTKAGEFKYRIYGAHQSLILSELRQGPFSQLDASTKFKINESVLSATDKAVREILDAKFMHVINKIQGNTEIQSMGDLIRAIDGDPSFAQGKVDHASNYFVENKNKDAYVKDKELEGLFKTIHLGVLKLRNPKDGLNNWVHQNVEMITDSRMGPVHKTNMLDVINPLDADFDIDKSVSYMGVPAEIMAQTYDVSGLSMKSDSDMVETVIRSYAGDGTLSTSEAVSLIKEWRNTDRERGGILRQVATLSTLLNFAESTSPLNRMIMPTAGQLATRQHFHTAKNGIQFTFTPDGKSYIDLASSTRQESGERIIVSLKTEGNISNSIDFLKNLSKHAIDYYVQQTKQGSLKGRIDDIYTNPEFGLFSVYVEKNGKRKLLQIDSADLRNINEAIYNTRGGVSIVREIGNLHNLSRGEEKGSNAKLKLSPWEYLARLDQIRYNIYSLRNFFKKEGVSERAQEVITTLSNQMLSFLSTEGKNRMTTPFIEGLLTMERAKNDKGKYQNSFDINSPLMRALHGAFAGSDGRQEFNRLLKDQFQNADSGALTLNYVAHEMEKLAASKQFIMNNKYNKDYESSQAWKWLIRREERLLRIQEKASRFVDDARIVKGYEVRTGIKAHTRARPSIASQDMAIHEKRTDADGVEGYVKVAEYKKGDKIIENVKKGSKIVTNPRRIVGVDPQRQMHREALMIAFGDPQGRSRKIAQSLLPKLYADFFDAKGRGNVFRTPDRRVEMGSEMNQNLDIMRHFYKDTVNRHGIGVFEEIIYEMLTPRASNDEITFDGKLETGNSPWIYKPILKSNAFNESLVFDFLGKSAQGDVGGVDASWAKKMLTEKIYRRHANAVVTVHNKVAGMTSLFLDNHLRLSASANEITSFRRYEETPMLLVLEPKVNDLKAQRSREQLLRYQTGEILLDPVELMRHTVNAVGKEKLSLAWKGSIEKEIDHKRGLSIRLGMPKTTKRLGKMYNEQKGPGKASETLKKMIPEKEGGC